MIIKVIKGTKQIGGCIVEISNEETKIIIDFGEDLLSSSKKQTQKPCIDGLTIGKPKYDAVFITHSHGDHIGLINNILEDIPVYVEPTSKVIYETLNDFTKKEKIRKTLSLEFECPIIIKNMKITPFIVDHSSYNSCMILIESNGKRILHTGDYRNHGYKGKLFIPILKKIGKVDVLITEGTSIDRVNEKYLTEQELSIKSEEIFKKYNQVLLLQSSTNIDRIITFYKASNKSKKNFIEDLFTASIASKISSKIPNPVSFNNVNVWIPIKYKKKDKKFKDKYIKPMEKYCNSKVLYQNYTMLVKTSMIEDIELLQKKNLLDNACLIYSMWNGYMKDDSFKLFLNKLKKLNIKVISMHTSGHADRNAMSLMEKLVNPDKTILIHCNESINAKEVFKKIIYINDNEEVIV